MSLPARLILKNRTFVRGSPHQKILGIGILLIIILVLATVLLVYLLGDISCETRCIQELGWAWWGKLRAEQPFAAFLIVIAPFALGLQIAYMRIAGKRESLVLSETGIAYNSPLPESFKFLQPDWSLQWMEVQHVRLTRALPGAAAHLAALVLDTGIKRKKVLLYPWVDPQHYEPRSLLGEARAINRLRGGADHSEILASPILRFIAEHVPQLDLDTGTIGEEKAFALNNNRWTLAVVMAMFGLMAYGLIDAFVVLQEDYADGPFYALYASVGLLVVVMVWLLLRAKRVPVVESGGVAMLTGLAFAFAMYPAVLRINQFTDQGGLLRYEYRLKDYVRFAPTRSDLPELRLRGYADYWSQFPLWSVHEFQLRHGGLGFYQINMAPIHDAMRAYYRRRD